MIDTGMAGEPELNAVYRARRRRALPRRAGPGRRRAPLVLEGSRAARHRSRTTSRTSSSPISTSTTPAAAAPWLERFPGATVWVHERGAPHLADPTRLVASTARTYGAARMRELFGETRACRAGTHPAVTDGDLIDLGDHRLSGAPHARARVAPHRAARSAGGGRVHRGGDRVAPAVGDRLPACAAAARGRRRARAREHRAHPHASSLVPLLTSHFGPVPDPDEHARSAAERVRAWAEAVRTSLDGEPDAPTEADRLVAARPGRDGEFQRRRAGRSTWLDRYDATRVDRDERRRARPLLAQALGQAERGRAP